LAASDENEPVHGGTVTKASFLALCAASFLSACGPGQLFGTTLTPALTSTGTTTRTAISTNPPRSTPTSTPTPTPTPRPVAGPLTVDGIEILLTSAGMECTTCYIRFLTIAVGNGGKCLSVNGNVIKGYYKKASTIDFSQWSVQMDHAYEGVYAGSGPGEVVWVFILPVPETMFIVDFPGNVNVDISPIID
jgi:hypothetical protein